MRTNTTVGEVEKQSTTYRSPWFRSCVIGRSNSGHECASARPHQGDEATSKRRSSAACLHCSVESAFLCLTFPWHSTRSSWPRAHASATTPPLLLLHPYAHMVRACHLYTHLYGFVCPLQPKGRARRAGERADPRGSPADVSPLPLTHAGEKTSAHIAGPQIRLPQRMRPSPSEI